MHFSNETGIQGITEPKNADELSTKRYLDQTLEPAALSTIGPADSVLMFEAPFTNWRLTTSPREIGHTRSYPTNEDYPYAVANLGGFYLSAHANRTLNASTDGINWTRRTAGTGYYLDRAEEEESLYFFYHNGEYLIHNARYYTCRKLHYSTDTIVWHTRTIGSFADRASEIAIGNGMWVMGENASNRLTKSTDGIAWTSEYDSSKPFSLAYSIAFGQGQFVAQAGSEIAVSVDTYNWVMRTAALLFGSASFYRDRGLKYLPWLDSFYINDYSGANNYYSWGFAYSTDAIVWKNGNINGGWKRGNDGSDPSYRYSLIDVYHDGGPQVAHYSLRNILVTSTDLINWRARSSMPYSRRVDSTDATPYSSGGYYIPFQRIVSVASGDREYGQYGMSVACRDLRMHGDGGSVWHVGLGEYVWASPKYNAPLNSDFDLNTSRSFTGSAEWTGYGNYRFKVPKQAKKMYIELIGGGRGGESGKPGYYGGRGGSSGQKITTLLDVADLDETVDMDIIPGQMGPGGKAYGLARTTDAVHWEAIQQPMTSAEMGNSGCLGFAYNPTATDPYVIVGQYSPHAICSSTDAINWVIRTRATGVYVINDVGAGNGLFVAVGDNRTTEASTDGIHWTQRTSNVDYYLRKYIYSPTNNTHHIFGGDRDSGISTDTIHWENRYPSGLNYYSSFEKYKVAYGEPAGYGPCFVTAGNNSQTSTSTDGRTWYELNNNRKYGGNMYSVAYFDGKFYFHNNNSNYFHPQQYMFSWTPATDTFQTEDNFYQAIQQDLTEISPNLRQYVYRMYFDPNPNINALVVTDRGSDVAAREIIRTTDAIHWAYDPIPFARGRFLGSPPVYDGTHSYYAYEIDWTHRNAGDTSIKFIDNNNNTITITAYGGRDSNFNTSNGYFTKGSGQFEYLINGGMNVAGGQNTGNAKGADSRINSLTFYNNSVIGGTMAIPHGASGGFTNGDGGDAYNSEYGQTTVAKGGSFPASPDGDDGVSYSGIYGAAGGGGGAEAEGLHAWKKINLDNAHVYPDGGGSYFKSDQGGIATDGNIFLVAARYGYMMASTDGIVWQQNGKISPVGDTSQTYTGGCEYSGSIWAATIGKRSLWTSTDTYTWSNRTVGYYNSSYAWANYIKRVKYPGDGLWWSSGNRNVFMSTDTIVWSLRTWQVSGYNRDIDWDGYTYFSANSSYVQTSTDAATWEREVPTFWYGYQYATICKRNVPDPSLEDTCVIPASNGGLLSFRTGVGWTRRTHGHVGGSSSWEFHSGWVYDQIYYLMSYYSNTAYISSTDAISWTTHNVGANRSVRMLSKDASSYGRDSDGTGFVYRLERDGAFYRSKEGTGGASGRGGDAAGYGAGGGGGGASTQGYLMGRGGNGGPGRVFISWW